jgi:hypothetical protein
VGESLRPLNGDGPRPVCVLLCHACTLQAAWPHLQAVEAKLQVVQAGNAGGRCQHMLGLCVEHAVAAQTQEEVCACMLGASHHSPGWRSRVPSVVVC